MNDRYEWFLEKATEIESMKFSHYLIVLNESIKMTVDKIILTAMKQANGLYLPN
jgi:hypothetical protein